MPQSSIECFVLPRRQYTSFNWIDHTIVAPSHLMLAVIDNHGRLWLIDLETNLLKLISGPDINVYVTCACFSSDSQYLIFGDLMDKIFFYNTNTAIATHFSITNRPESLLALANQQIVVATKQPLNALKTIEQYDFQGNHMATFDAKPHDWRYIASSIDETLLIGIENIHGPESGTFISAHITLFGMMSKKMIKQFDIDFKVFQAKLTPDNTWLICCGASGNINLWHVKTSQLSHIITFDSCLITTFDYCGTGRYLAIDNSRQITDKDQNHPKSKNQSYISIYDLKINKFIEQIPCEDALNKIFFINNKLLACSKQTVHSLTLPLLAMDNSHTYIEFRPPLTMHHDYQVQEIIKRVSIEKQNAIIATLAKVTLEHQIALAQAISDQKNLLHPTSFIHDKMFAFTALEAVRLGRISQLQFGTLMALWGNLSAMLTNDRSKSIQIVPKYVPLFTDQSRPCQHASDLLLSCLKPPPTAPYLVLKSPKTLLNEIYHQAIHLPESEQGFWIIPNNNNYGDDFNVTHAIKVNTKIIYLAFEYTSAREMLPSFGLQQIFLDTAFPHAVKIKPVIGHSPAEETRTQSLARYRNIAVPFPDNNLPIVADNFPAHWALDFIFHDRYHAIRASRVLPQETAFYVAIGDILWAMQKRYNCIVMEFSKRHDSHINLLPKLADAIKNLCQEKKHQVIMQVLKKFNQEIVIINLLKQMRKANGQLKFQLWDMEPAYSGTTFDNPEEECQFTQLQRILGHVESLIQLLEKKLNTCYFNSYATRKVAHAVLDVVKPTPQVLIQIQALVKANQRLLFFLPNRPNKPAFDEAILTASANFS